VGTTFIKNCAWCYPEPVTHQYVRNHLTFQSKGGLSIIDIKEIANEHEANNDSLVSKK